MPYKNLVTEEELCALLSPEEQERMDREQANDEAGGGAEGAGEENRRKAAHDGTEPQTSADRDQPEASQAAAEEPRKADDTFDRKIQPGDLLSMRVLELEAVVEALTLRVAILERRLERQAEREEQQPHKRTPAQGRENAIDVDGRVKPDLAPSKSIVPRDTPAHKDEDGETPLSRLERYSGRKHTQRKKWF